MTNVTVELSWEDEDEEEMGFVLRLGPCWLGEVYNGDDDAEDEENQKSVWYASSEYLLEGVKHSFSNISDAKDCLIKAFTASQWDLNKEQNNG